MAQQNNLVGNYGVQVGNIAVTWQFNPFDTISAVGAGPIFQGRVFNVYRGAFGEYRNVYLKRTDADGVLFNKTHAELVRNDITMTQRLSGCPYIARYFHHGVVGNVIVLAVESYQQNLKAFIDAVEGGARRADEYDWQRLFKQLFMAIDYLHQEGIVHRDIRMKNVYIQRYGSEY